MRAERAELLAPAGSYEGFEAAIRAGADAVYAGGSLFGARAYAKNFEQEEMLRAIRTAHLFDRKFYLTVNTLLKNRELEESLEEYLRPYYEEGLDAVLVQDFGVLQLIRERFPDLPVHASTQMTVTGPAGAQFLQNLGLTRVVPARELSLQELERIHKHCPDLEIETFVHGALCYSYSGQCLMSSLIGGRSGNRGRCAQPCRLPYQMGEPKSSGKKKNTEYTPLSMKDLNTLPLLPEILEAGVYSLKIEGRMKQPQYTAGVTQIYRKYLDLYLEKGREGYTVAPEDLERLNRIFSRGGSCEGYYKTYHGPGMISRTNERKVTEEAEVTMPPLKRPIRGKLVLEPGKPAVLEAWIEKLSARKISEEAVQEAKSRPLEESRIRQQMEKLGNTPFVWSNLVIEGKGSLFIPMGVLNELRRAVIADLQEQLENRGSRRNAAGEQGIRSLKAGGSTTVSESSNPKISSLPIYVSCENEEVASAALNHPEVKGVYLPWNLTKKFLAEGISTEKEIYLAFPHISRNHVEDSVYEEAKVMLEQGLCGFLVRDLETFCRLKQRGLENKVVLDHSMYTWNDRAVDFWKEQGVLRNTVPLELNKKEIGHRENHDSELLVYGYLPMMTSVQCLRKNSEGCSGKEEQVRIQDRYQNTFVAKCYCMPWKPDNTAREKFCYNVIYNRLAFGIPNPEEIPDSLNLKSLRLAFTVEQAGEAKKILSDFIEAIRGGKTVRNSGELTRGHYRRGVE